MPTAGDNDVTLRRRLGAKGTASFYAESFEVLSVAHLSHFRLHRHGAIPNQS